MIDELYTYVRQHDYESYIAALLTKDPAARGHVMAIFGLRYELAHILEITREPMTGFVRLAWWRDRVSDLYAEKPPEKHLVLHALAEFISESHPSKTLFDDVLVAYSDAIESKTFPKIEVMQPLVAYAVGLSQGKTLRFLQKLETEKSRENLSRSGFKKGLLPLRALLFDLFN